MFDNSSDYKYVHIECISSLPSWDNIKNLNKSEHAVKSALSLPSTDIKGNIITWTSDNSSVSDTTGAVTRPVLFEDDIKVKLTATVSGGGFTDTKTFDLTVATETWDEHTDTYWYDNGNLNITSAEELAGFAQIVNTKPDSFTGKTVNLMADIDLSEYPWVPIGAATNPFEGIFDGNSHEISGLKFVNYTTGKGLFGYNKGTVKNFGVTGLSITKSSATYSSGGIASDNTGGAIENCYASGSITADRSGGLVGANDTGTILNCYFTGAVTGAGSGGVAGSNGEAGNPASFGSIENAYYPAGPGSAVGSAVKGFLTNVGSFTAPGSALVFESTGGGLYRDTLLQALNTSAAERFLDYDWFATPDKNNGYPMLEPNRNLSRFAFAAGSHAINVKDYDGNFVQGAVVTIGSRSFTTDMLGTVRISEGENLFGLNRVSIEPPDSSLRKGEAYYILAPGQSRNIFLESGKPDGKPYITMAVDAASYADVRASYISFMQFNGDMLSLLISGNWNGNDAGVFRLYQSGGRYFDGDSSGVIDIAPGLSFNAGETLWLKMIAPDGVESDPVALRLIIIPSNPPSKLESTFALLDSSNQFTATSQDNGSASGGAQNMFPAAMKLPVSIMAKLVNSPNFRNDGTIIIRGVIGRGDTRVDEFLEPADSSSPPKKNPDYGRKVADDDKLWDEYKNDFNTAKNNLGYPGALDTMVKKYGIYKKDFTIVKDVVDGDFGGVGYFEAIFNVLGEQRTSTGGVILAGGANGRFSKQFTIGPVPVYVEIGGGLNIGGALDLAIGLGWEGVTYEGNAMLVIHPYLWAEAGVGVKGLAYLGVGGNLDLDIRLFASMGNGSGMAGSTGKFDASAYVKMQLLFIFDWKWTLARYEKMLWDKRVSTSPAAPYAAIMPSGFSLYGLYDDLYLEDAGFEVASRDYLSATSPWNGSWTGGPLQSSVLPGTIPMLAKAGDQTVMLFHADDGVSATGNHIRLMYSVLDGGVWSEPKPAWETGASDFFAKTQTVNNELYLIWQKSKASTSSTRDDELMDEVLSNIEVCAAKWDKNTKSFAQQAFLTDNDVVEMNPILASNGETVTALWTEVREGSPFYEVDGGLYAVMSRTLKNGVWSEAETLFETENYIDELAAGYVDGTLKVAYCTFGVDGKPNIWVRNGVMDVPVSCSKGASGIRFFDGMLIWQEEGGICYYDFAVTGGIPALKAGESPISASYKILKSGSKQAIVWAELNPDIYIADPDTGGFVIDPDKDRYMIRASILDNGEYGPPITLTTVGGELENFDVSLTDRGVWQIVMNTYEITYDTSGEPHESGHKLAYAEVTPVTDIALDYAYADPIEAENGIQPVNLVVTNKGETPVRQVSVSFTGNGTVEQNVALSPGATMTIRESVDLDKLPEDGQMVAEVTCEGDSDPDNNSFAITLGLVDVAVEASQYRVDDNIFVMLNLSNSSPVETPTALVIRENDENGAVLFEDYRYILGNQDNCVVCCQFNIDQLGDNVNALFVEAKPAKSDSNLFNNTAVIPVNKDHVEAPVDPVEEIIWVPATGVSISGGSVFYMDDDNEVSLTATVLPVNASNKDVVWSSSDESVVYVSNSGKLTFNAPGTATITAVAKDGGYSAGKNVTVKDALYSLTVNEAVGGYVTIGEDRVDGQELALAGGAEITLEAEPYTGYRFDGWLGSVDSFDDSNSPSAVFTMPDSSAAVTPVFIRLGKDPVLESIMVTPPLKTEYLEGENLDLTGLYVSANYEEGDSFRVSGYTISPDTETPLMQGMERVIVSYTDGGITKTDTFAITVNEAIRVFSVTGLVKSYNPRHETTVSLMRGDIEIYKEVIAANPVSGQSEQAFTFLSVAPGDYTLVITKKGHTSFTVEKVVVDDDNLDLTQDIRPEVRLMMLRCGDINGDGMINDDDLTVLWMLENYNRKTSDAFEQRCDLNGDGMVNDMDLTILWMAANYNQGMVEIL